MVSINYSAREVCCKIVYYGPGLSGKTTNLQYVHNKVPGNTRGDLISLATEADRTLYFDFLPINIGSINGFTAKFQLYTVPGQVYYNATRKLVLRGVDGLVFVADSQPDKMDENIESLMNLEDNLREYGYDINDLPIVIQYNKRDLPGILSVQELDAQLNRGAWPTFEASATIGNGVFDTLKLIIKLVLEKAKSTGGPRPQPVEAAHTSVEVASSAAPSPVSTPAIPTPPAPTAHLTVRQPDCDPASQPAGVPPVADSPSPTSSSGPVQTVATAEQTSSVTSVSSTPTPAEQQSEVATYRPYPGDEKGDAPARKISSARFAPTRKEDSSDVSFGKSVLKSDQDGKPIAPSSLSTPAMAPSLRRRSGSRKRGFFKRLFGLK